MSDPKLRWKIIATARPAGDVIWEAVVSTHDDVKVAREVLDCEKLCWSDEGISYRLVRYVSYNEMVMRMSK